MVWTYDKRDTTLNKACFKWISPRRRKEKKFKIGIEGLTTVEKMDDWMNRKRKFYHLNLDISG